jgi:hypothetical protein
MKMPQYEYKTVPAPMILSVKNEAEERTAIAKFGEAITGEAVNGWVFVTMETITTGEAPGCMGGKTVYKTHNMLIFKRPIKDKEDE